MAGISRHSHDKNHNERIAWLLLNVENIYLKMYRNY